MPFDIDEQYDKIYRFCYLRVKNREIAEDLTQETFLRYLERPQYQQISKTLELLYTIAGNLCVDEFRKRKNLELPEDTASNDDMEDTILSNYALHQALDSLSDEDREIILMRYINDVPISVIGRVYELSRFTVYRRIKKALDKLHGELLKEEI